MTRLRRLEREPLEREEVIAAQENAAFRLRVPTRQSVHFGNAYEIAVRNGLIVFQLLPPEAVFTPVFFEAELSLM